MFEHYLGHVFSARLCCPIQIRCTKWLSSGSIGCFRTSVVDINAQARKLDVISEMSVVDMISDRYATRYR